MSVSVEPRLIKTKDVKEDKISKEVYAASIPPCCNFRTIEDHENIGLCWGLITRLERNKPITGLCDECCENSVSPYAINSLGGS